MRSVLLFAFVTLSVAAQHVDVKGSLGYTSFLDEAPDNHLLVAGSARFYITRKFSVEPEVQYLRRDSRHPDWVFVPNFTYDFKTGRRTLCHHRPRRATKLRQQFQPHRRIYQWGQWGQALFTDRWFIAPEFRLGLEPHARLSAAIGYSFRR